MKRKNKAAAAPKPERDDKPATLKDMLDPDTVAKLKAKADAVQAEESARREQRRKQEDERRQAEQKARENDFEYLLNNSRQDWKKFK